MRRKAEEIMKEENCFACDKKSKQKKRSSYSETLSRITQDDGLTTLIDT